ncbi:oxidase [Flavobacterium resistens]|uniref:Oxidase n=2 Tax=Flavobacterium resistens TaxID=443612 RepID=A0ABW9QBQ4_9FLAO|nr:oxidase [Flavobacterium resistens]
MEFCLMTDIFLNKTGDLDIQNGDIVIDYSDNQHQEHILLANKGDYKEFPELGVGINNMLNEDDFLPFLIEAKKNLQYDGMKINNIKFEENGNLNINGDYQ